MGGQDCLSSSKGINMVIQVLYLLLILPRDSESCGVGYIADRCASLCDCLYHSRKVFVVSTSGIFRIELHVFHVLLRVLHRRHGTLYYLLPVGLELVENVAVTRTDTRMYSLVLGILQSLGSTVDVLFDCSCQGTDYRPRHGFTYLYDRVEVSRA